MQQTQSQQGITILNILLSLGIGIILMLGWLTFVVRGYRGISFGEDQFEAARNAQKGIEILTQEIREASTAENGSYTLEVVDDQEIIFYSDIDEDSSVERVHYYLNGETLMKGVIEPTGDPLDYTDPETLSIVAESVINGSNPIFTYYNEDYPLDTINNPLPTPSRLIDTKLINVFLKINIDPNRAPIDFDVESDVQIRNLKTNL
jgi:hypothetical protein